VNDWKQGKRSWRAAVYELGKHKLGELELDGRTIGRPKFFRLDSLGRRGAADEVDTVAKLEPPLEYLLNKITIAPSKKTVNGVEEMTVEKEITVDDAEEMPMD